MIDMNKKYKTRDGRKVRVLCTDRKDDIWPVVALVDDGCGYEEINTYTPNGFLVAGDNTDDQLDLIEVKTVTYLKSIQKILEENSEACFDGAGVIANLALSGSIHPEMFKYFDKPLAEAGSKWSYWDSWKEEREV